MNKRYRLPVTLSTAGLMALACATAYAEEPGAESTEAYAPLLWKAPARGGQDDFSGQAELGFGYTDDDNFKFGQYNGLNEDRATLIGKLRWQSFDSDSYWRVSVSDIGLDTREGSLTWGQSDRLRIALSFDSQLQVKNDSGRTPFSGDTDLTLPQGWVSGATTSDFSVLEASLRGLSRELEREKLSLAVDYKLSDSLSVDSTLSYEDKSGTTDTAGALYTNAAGGDTVLLPSPVDYRTAQFDVGLSYSGTRLHLQGRIDHSDFDNKDELLTWQNPYSSFGPGVRYPDGVGGIGLAPDNSQTRGRLSGQFIISSTARFQFDGSYAVLEQDQDFLDYTVNPALNIAEPLPRESFDGEVEHGNLNLALLVRPLPKLNVKGFLRLRERDYDVPRDGYRYVRGDAGRDAPDAFAVYNTAHDYLSRSAGMNLDYRLPRRSRLSFEYAYDKVERRNAAVEETEEDQFTLGYRVRPWQNFSARLEAHYAERRGSTYNWDQRYYALLDPELINATPDNQRFINHPELSQHHLSDRERIQAKADFNWQSSEALNLTLNLLWRDDNYNRSELGLTEAQWQRAHLSANYAATESVSASFYTSFDQYESEQTGRAFRGGQEKNAFDIYPPLPQASDPGRDWDLNASDDSYTLGANLVWQAAGDLDLAFDYNYVETDSGQQLDSVALDVKDLPDADTRLHHVTASGTWRSSEALSLRLEYQYYGFEADDYALGNSAQAIDKVLSFGDEEPDEDIHYVGATAIYRW